MRKRHLPLQPCLGTRRDLDPFAAWLLEKSWSLLPSQTTLRRLQARQGCRLALISGTSGCPTAPGFLHTPLGRFLPGTPQLLSQASFSWGPSAMIFYLQNMNRPHSIWETRAGLKSIVTMFDKTWMETGRLPLEQRKKDGRNLEKMEKKELNKLVIDCITQCPGKALWHHLGWWSFIRIWKENHVL